MTNEYDYVSKRQKRNDDYDETYDNDSYVFDDPEDGSRHSYVRDLTVSSNPSIYGVNIASIHIFLLHFD